ncbi:MAG: mannosyltransferase B-like protein [uncultured bacterium]|nr:MAG: mannosyltransferase B-like protein [uncultured bacterium]
MKIAIDIRNIGKGRTGDEVVFFNLVKNLAVIDDVNQYVLLTDRNPQKDLLLRESIEKMQLKPNFSVIHLCEDGANKFLWNAWVLPQYLKKNPVDILQVQYITPFFISRKIKIVTILHDVSFKVYPKLIKKSDLFFLNMLIPMSLRRADKIIGVSRFTIQEIIKYYKVNPDKLDWIHNAVGENFQKEISHSQMELVRKKYGLPQKFILYIGTLQPRKNLPSLIEAYIKIPTEKREGLKLVLAGGKGYNFDPEIEKSIESYSLRGHVILPGFVDEEDKPTLFKLSHVFCFPSLYEGFGIPVLEAMTLGVPVLASSIDPHMEVAENSILFFDAANPADFSEKLTRIISDDSLRIKLIEQEKERASKFSWQNTAKKILEIYDKLDNKTK